MSGRTRQRIPGRKARSVPCRMFPAVLLLSLTAAFPPEVSAQGTRPSIAVYQPTGTQAGEVTIPFSITDPESDPVGLKAEYSINEGGSWTAASVSSDTSDIAAAGYAASLLWQSATDFPGQEIDRVWFRVTPHDAGGWGPVDITHIDIDNQAPRWGEVYGVIGDSIITFSFHEPVMEAAATDPASYTLDQGLTAATVTTGEQWTTLANMPTSRECAASGIIDGKLYVVGGTSSLGNVLSTLEVYNPATNTWTTKSSMSTARQELVAGVIGGKLYAVGGRSGFSVTVLEAYDPATNLWTTKAPMPDGRYRAAAAVIDGKLYVVGGNDGGIYKNDLYVYDPLTNTWDSTRQPMPTARECAVAGILDGRFYVAGGYNGGYLSILEVYDPATNTWSTKPNMLTGRGSAAGGVLGDRLIVATGYNGSYLSSVEVFDPVANSWSPAEPIPGSRRNPTAAIDEDTMYFAGGFYWTSYLPSLHSYRRSGFTLEVTDGQALGGPTVTLTAANITDYHGNAVAAPIDTTFTAVNLDTTRPSVSLLEPAGARRQDVPIRYLIEDPENSLVGLLAEYSTDDGATWLTASVSGDTSGIKSTKYAGSVIWESGTDLSGEVLGAFKFRITPHDPWGWGTADTISIDIDSQTPRWGEVHGAIGDSIITFSFHEPVREAAATDPASYTLDQGLTAATVTIGEQWTTLANMPTSRECTASGIIDGKLYVVGGTSSLGNELSTLEVYNPATNTWTTKSSMSTSREEPVAGVIGGRLYVAGGRSGFSVEAVEEYDPATNMWSTRAPMPEGRYRAASAVIDDKLYVVGGNDGGIYKNDLYVYDPLTDTWDSTRQPMPTAREFAVAGALDGQLYVAGGYNGSYLSILEVYDPAADTWSTRPNMLTGRSNAGGGFLGDRLVVAGGYNGGYLSSVEVFDPVANAWLQAEPMSGARRNPTAAIDDGTMYVAGGFLWTSYLSKLESYRRSGFTLEVTDGQALGGPTVTLTAAGITDYPGNTTAAPIDTTFTPDDPYRPGIELEELTTVQSGDVTVGYLITDTGGSTVGLFVEYSTDSGGSWSPATVSGDTSGIPGAAYDGTLVWQSGTDLADQEVDGAWLKITPHDSGGWGTPDTIEVDIDNRAPQWIDARAVAGSDSLEFWFDEPVVDARAMNTGNIALSGGLTIDTIEKVPNWVVEEENILWRADPAAVTVGRKLYLIAGEGKDGEPATRNSMEIFDFDTGQWELRSGYPFDLGHAWAVAVGNTIYMGGYEDRFYKYDIGSDTWTQLTAVSGIAFSAVAVIDGLIYVAGGDEFGSGAVGTLRIFNPVLETWSYGSSMAEAREYAAYGVIDDRIYVAGGTGNGGDLTTAEVYDPDTDTWEYISSLLSPEGTTMGWTLGNRLYMVGNDTLWVYDALSDTWSYESETPRDRVLHAVSVFEGRAYILGGFISSGQWPLVDSYDPITRYRTFLTDGQHMPFTSVSLTASNMADPYGNTAGPLSTDFVPNDTNEDPEIALTPIGTEVSGEVSIGYTLTDLEGDTIDLSPRYSSDGGSTWRMMTTASDTAGITSDAYSGTIVWQSTVDEPGSDVSDLRVQVGTADNAFETGGSDEITFHLDNNAVPEIAITGTSTYAGADTSWTVGYDLSDTESDPLAIDASYSLTGGATWAPATVAGDTAGITPAEYSGSLKWLVGRDVPVPGGDMIFRLRPRDNDPGTPDSIDLPDWSDSTPHITLSTPQSGELSGEVTVDYRLVDLDDSAVDLTAEFHDPDGSWQTATVTGTLTGLTPAAYTGSLTWHSATDLAGVDDETAWFRITPSDGSGGVADTLVVPIDNNAPPVINLGAPAGGVLARDIPLEFTLTDAENDVLSLHGYWRNGSGGTWQPITSFEPSTGLQPGPYPDQVTWHSLADLGYAHFDSILVMLVPADLDTGQGSDGSYFEVCNYVGDYTGDLLIGAADWAVLTAAWNTQDTSHDIGPATGTLPWLTPTGDGLIDFEDLAVFSIMWNELASGGGEAALAAARQSFGGQPVAPSGRPGRPVPADHPVVLRSVAPDDVWAQENNLAIYRIEAVEVSGLSAAQLILQYDPDHFAFLEVRPGDFLGAASGRDRSLISLKRVDQQAGIIELLLGRIRPEDPDVDGSGVLMEVEFRELSTEDHAFTLACDLYDRSAGRLGAAVYEANLQSMRRPDEFVLMQNYPNPFNGETTIRFALPKQERIRLVIYNVRAQVVRTLLDEEMEPGYHRVRWDGRGEDGRQVASGIYIYLLQTGSNRQSRKLTIIK